MSNLQEIQNRSLEMAEYFVEFCNEHGLLCYLCGGGAIGTLRHKGFIPWDDDLDFFMPREDYEKLQVLWQKYADKRYFLSKSNRDFVDRNLFITIRDTQTTCIKPYQQDLNMPHGLALDVLPLDYYPKDSTSRKKQVRWALIYSLFCAQTIPTNHGKLMQIGSTVLLGITPKTLRYKIWKKAEHEMTKYTRAESDGITELCSGPGYMKKKYPLDAFDESIFMPFEQTKMPIPKGYDVYLKTAFGDYMTPPPKEKQVPHHDALVTDMEKSYLEYGGEYGR
ncbi:MULTISPECIES: LicD family protein [Gemella]|uniref:LicD family protein n=1 Tax=Gemella TaxID=1378 RepID=UPI000768220D|nr:MULTISPECIES: phosphorylcholine transferase LicD [Gemella]AME08888.1 2-C-methyl-D-erythritol 4-phosphate cytidylyltransferase [Gemella sp. oral taxon 928]